MYILRNHLLGILSAIVVVTCAHAALPDPGMEVVVGRTALLITDPQNDFLSPKVVTWGVVGKSVEANDTVANIGVLLKTAKQAGMPVFISPHYYYPTDHGWKFEGALESLMHQIGMFDRKGALTVDGFFGQFSLYCECGVGLGIGLPTFSRFLRSMAPGKS